ncbi:MAG TPA: site-2 protease family protein [Thermoanaerobaculia bacterium]
MLCAACQTEVAPALLSCPVCHSLVHADELKRLAREAEAAESDRPTEALAVWRRALGLLPSGSRQAEAIAGRVETLSRRVEAMPGGGGERRSFRRVWKAGGWLAAGALLLWKLKAVLLIALSKGKLLLVGLTKVGTLSTMLLSAGIYWGIFGWKLAFGLIASIYVHEMGHVAALRRFGIPASAPMFIPGIGAFVRLRQKPVSAREDARVGLAGPLWGLGAAVAAWGVYLAGGGPIWAAIAKWGALINLFNLLPLWGLDGGRGFHALSRNQKILAAAALGVLWAVTREGMLILLLILAVFQAFSRRNEEPGDRLALAQYVFLAAVLSAMCRMEVPGV